MISLLSNLRYPNLVLSTHKYVHLNYVKCKMQILRSSTRTLFFSEPQHKVCNSKFKVCTYKI